MSSSLVMPSRLSETHSQSKRFVSCRTNEGENQLTNDKVIHSCFQ
jgi:hypothetical protein